MAEASIKHEEVCLHTDSAVKHLPNGTVANHNEQPGTEHQARTQAIYCQRIGRRKVDEDGTTTWISQSDWDEYQRQSDASAAQQSKFAFCVDDSDTKSKIKIKITSPGLVYAVKKTIPWSLFESLSGSVLFQEPYSALLQYHGDMRRELQARYSLNSEALEDFNALVYFLESHTAYGVWRSMDGQYQASVTFENLWALFRDGDLLVLQDQLEERRLFKFTRLEEEISDEGPLKGRCTKVWVHFWYISWSSGDKAFRRSSKAIRITRFAGMRRVLALPIYPLRYDSEDSSTELFRQLQGRGEKWSAHVSNPPACFEYSGHAVLEEDGMLGENTGPTYIRGRVITDQKGLIGRIIADVEAERGSSAMDHSLNDSWSASRFFKTLDPTEVRFCPSQIRAYHVSTGKNYLVNVTGLQPVKWEDTAIQKLVLDKGKKDLLKAFVSSTNDWQSRSGDIISNKGRGLTIVLHGPPGVGKTLTAECMAEYAGKPLIHLSVGDLVAFDDSIEERLTDAFETAGRLGAILLLDEADVVLEARSFEDVRRNGIVSVFLRQLEYYNGILFMTTNRINSIDPAFQSRIQTALHYPEFTSEKRQEIWLNLLSSNLIDCTDEDRATIQDNVVRLAAYQLNGRQIRNTLKLSGFAAAADLLSRGKVQLNHITEALEVTLAFQDYFEGGKKDMKNKSRVWKPFMPAQSQSYQ